MIFVTVGTHEQPFDRLLQCMDEWKQNGLIEEDIIMQTGYSTFRPKHCRWTTFCSYEEIDEYMKQAHMVITHGGPSSIYMCIENGTIPIVMPRRAEFGEHVNDHQVAFCRTLSEQKNNILLVDSTEDLLRVIQNYDTLASERLLHMSHHNKEFCDSFTEQVEKLYE